MQPDVVHPPPVPANLVELDEEALHDHEAAVCHGAESNPNDGIGDLRGGKGRRFRSSPSQPAMGLDAPKSTTSK